MDDLERALRAVDEVRTPDVWDDAVRRANDTEPSGPPFRARLATVLVVLPVVAAGGLALFDAFRHVVPASHKTGTNGPIVFIADGEQPELPFENRDAFAIDPETGTKTNLTNTPLVSEESPVWSPDSRRVVFVRTTASGTGAHLKLTRDLVLANADFSNQRVLNSCDDQCAAADVAWSPDGTSLAIVGGRRLAGGGSVIALWLYDIRTGAEREVCDSRTCGAPGQPAWSPDGATIAFSDAGYARMLGPGPPSGPLFVADAATLDVRRLTSTSTRCTFKQTCAFDSGPTWSPDGSAIAFVRSTQTSGTATSTVMTIGSDGTGEHALFECRSNDQCRQDPPSWAADGSTIAFIDRYDRPVLHVLDVRTGDDRPIELPPVVGEYPTAPVWSPDGSRIAFLGGGRASRLFVVRTADGTVADVGSADADGAITWLGAGAISGDSPVASPTKPTENELDVPPGRIVFSSANGSLGEDDGTEIWSIDTDGSGLRKLTTNETIDVSPVLSPDGSKIAFRSYRPGDRNTEIYVMNVDGSDQQKLTDERTGAGPPDWSPDGSKIAYQSSEGYGQDGGIFVMNADGTDARLVAEGNASDPSWSPNGRSIVYSLNDASGTFLHVVDVATGADHPLPRLVGEQQQPAWGPDGHTIAFVWWTQAGETVATMTTAGSDVRSIGQGQDPAWSPDGRWLVYAHADDTLGPQLWIVAGDGSVRHRLTSMNGFVGETTIFSSTSEPSWGPA